MIVHVVNSVVTPLTLGVADAAHASVARLADALIPVLEQRTGQTAERSVLLRALYRMRERQIIAYDPTKHQWKLTDKGIRRARTYLLDDLILPDTPAVWDGHWRVVAFDVPEQSKYLRTFLRRKLAALGFSYLQRSLWLYPFPCETEITELAHRLGLEDDIVVMRTESLSAEKKFLKRYRLHRETG
jgi:DNA-binding transcriptional regulator PaaX